MAYYDTDFSNAINPADIIDDENLAAMIE